MRSGDGISEAADSDEGMTAQHQCMRSAMLQYEEVTAVMEL